MKNNEFLQNAIGSIDDDLITDAVKPIKKRNLLRIAIVSAACVSILLTLMIPLFIVGEDSVESSNEEITQTISSDISEEDEKYPPKHTQNLWSMDDFSALSIVYGGNANICPVNNAESESGYFSDIAIEAEKIEITVDSTIKVESVLANRYIVYYSQVGYPIIYDSKEKKEVDLTDRIIGADRVDENKVYEAVIEVAEKSCPGISATQNNRDIIFKLVMNWMNLNSYDEYFIKPDIEFLKDHEIYGETYELYLQVHPEYLYEIFREEIMVAYMEVLSDGHKSQAYSISILWIDAQSGRCLVRTHDISGDTCDTLVYDLVNDKIIQLSIDNLGAFPDGYEIEFSKDGSFFTITRPTGTIIGDKGFMDGQGNQYDADYREIIDYNGEYYSVVYIDNFNCVEIKNSYDQSEGFGCSKAYFSENGKVIYYKLLSEKLQPQIFKCDEDVWYNRLARFDNDEDIWVFCTIQNGYAKKTKIQGKFIKFACNETVVIMEKGGKYYAYLIEDGSDVTDKVINNEIEIALNERLLVYYSENALYKKDIFTCEITKLITCDSYILNTDNSFAFTYKKGDNFVTCLNTVTTESRRIIIDDDLCKQLFANKNAVFKMNYNENDNTLSLSFYKTDEVKASVENKDFYSLISEIFEIDHESKPTDLRMDCGKIITDYTISESVLEAFRQYVIEYKKHEWVGDPSEIYPLGLNPSDKYQDVLEKLGITPNIDYIDMNGTCFILYEDEDERVEFYIGKFMPIYTPSDDISNNNIFIMYYYYPEKCYELM